MNFIDISSWQTGLDLQTLFERNSGLEGVIVKLTEGTNYVNPVAGAWISWLREKGKPFGTYHFLDGSGAKAEAQYYAKALEACPGGVMALDYEGAVTGKGTGYLRECLEEMTRLTGGKPLVYCTLSILQSQDFTAIAGAGYPLWLAQYADRREVHGFSAAPWQEGSVAPFSGFALQQYTACGRLAGWNGDLDFDFFRGGIREWQALAGVAGDAAPLRKPDAAVVSEVLNGRFGTGPERDARLREAGYDARAVQEKINELYSIADRCKTIIAGNEEYLDSLCRIMKTEEPVISL